MTVPRGSPLVKPPMASKEPVPETVEVSPETNAHSVPSAPRPRMTQEFAQTVAFMVRAELYVAATPYVGSALPDGRMVSFSEDLIVVTDRRVEPLAIDAVVLDSLDHDEKEARKLSFWLGALFGGRCGVVPGGAFSAYATREDGRMLEVGAFGYELYEDDDAFMAGVPCDAALRTRT